MTKKIITIITIMLILVVTNVGTIVENNVEYVAMTVVEIIEENEVICVDNNGSEWCFFSDDYKVGENIIVVMSNDCIVDVVE